MRLGFSLGSLLSIDQIIECSRILSRYDVDSIWIPETWGMDCCSTLAIVSQVATKPKIGSSIMNVYSRSPSLIAMTAATLDTISKGRVILGLGSSSKPIIENWHGLEFAESLSRMQEYVDIIRKILSGEKVVHDGKFFHLQDFSLLINPPRKQIPIYLAAVNEKMINLTWAIADGVIFYLQPIDVLNKIISNMQKKRKIDVACQLITCVSENKESAAERAKKTIAFYVSVGEIYRKYLSNNGFENETARIFDEYTKSGLKNVHNFVSDNMLDALAVYGNPSEMPKKVKKFIDAGVNLPILQFNPVGDVMKSFNLLVSSLGDEMR